MSGTEPQVKQQNITFHLGTCQVAPHKSQSQAKHKSHNREWRDKEENYHTNNNRKHIKSIYFYFTLQVRFYRWVTHEQRCGMENKSEKMK